jgi:hypothetical protein
MSTQGQRHDECILVIIQVLDLQQKDEKHSAGVGEIGIKSEYG